MIKFSEKNQAFYNFSFKYDDLPTDLVDVDSTQHIELLQFIRIAVKPRGLARGYKAAIR